MKLILASKSISRANMLHATGVEFEAQPADIDETAVQNADATPQEIAETLAAQKALSVSVKNAGTLVIGSDQVLECAGKLLNKAANENEARQKLQTLRGKTHHLVSSVCVAKDNQVLWQTTQSATLTMHDFDDAFLQSYIEKAGEALTRSVGAYELEALGAHLFEKIEGDFFTILGMPLLPLLEYLHTQHGLKL